jgi:hypothetical protein
MLAQHSLPTLHQAFIDNQRHLNLPSVLQQPESEYARMDVNRAYEEIAGVVRHAGLFQFL